MIPPTAHETILAATRQWLTRAVIGLNLCPFAKSVHIKQQIRYTVSTASSLDEALTALEAELRWLEQADAEITDTTLLILPFAFADFADFNDALALFDLLLRQLHLVGIFQLASFHPDYQFAGSTADDIENYTNRAPYPIIHLLREASIERAVTALPDAAGIYQRNQATLRGLGIDGWRKWMATADTTETLHSATDGTPNAR